MNTHCYSFQLRMKTKIFLHSNRGDFIYKQITKNKHINMIVDMMNILIQNELVYINKVSETYKT